MTPENISITDIQKIVHITRQNFRLPEDDIIEKILNVFNPETRPQLNKILIKACILHNQSIKNIISKSRDGTFVRVRQQYCLIAFMFDYYLSQIGSMIGNRNYITVRNAKNKALIFYQTESKYKHEVLQLINEFPKYKEMLLEKLERLIVEN